MKNGKRTTKGLVMWVATALSVFLPWAAPAWAESGCVDVAIYVEATATTPNPMGQYAGTADLVLDGVLYPGDVVINPVAMRFADDGTIHMEFRNAFTIPGLASVMDCHDQLVLVPTEDPSVFQINNRAYIQGGTGVFSEAYGKLSAHGTMYAALGQVTIEANGRICNLTGM